MKAVVILGSRNPQGQTAKAAEHLTDGLINKGVQVQKYFLPTMNFELCKQCDDAGWGICRTTGTCIIKDDFQMVVDAIKEADMVVFASPVYFSDLSERMKAFLDRLRRICMNENGQVNIKDKPVIGLCVAGGSGGGAPACIDNLERVLGICGFYIVQSIPLRRQNAEFNADTLKMSGQWLAELNFIK